MLFLTRWFGVTGSDAERSPAREQSEIKEITERVLLMQANAAAQQRQPLRRGTHAKGVCARAQFEVFDVSPSFATRCKFCQFSGFFGPGSRINKGRRFQKSV